MHPDQHQSTCNRDAVLLPMLWAGLGGGIAEMAWIALYSEITPLNVLEVLRQVVLSVFPGGVDLTIEPTVGVAIHLGLSLLLALAFGFLIWLPIVRGSGFLATMLCASAALTSVWVINFFILLPMLNPAFVGLMPYSVTFVSKLWFGITMGWILYRSDNRLPRVHLNIAGQS